MHGSTCVRTVRCAYATTGVRLERHTRRRAYGLTDVQTLGRTGVRHAANVRFVQACGRYRRAVRTGVRYVPACGFTGPMRVH